MLKTSKDDNINQNITLDENQDVTDKEAEQQKQAIEGLNNLDLDDDEHRETLVAEFRKIQQELSDVKENMSIVQALNERLSNELDLLSDLNKTRSISRSNSAERSRKNGCSEATDFTDGGQEANIFVFSEESAEKTEKAVNNRSSESLSSPPSQLTNELDIVDIQSVNDAKKQNESESDNESVNDRKQRNETETHKKSVKETEESENTEANGTTSTENIEVDFGKQLEKAMRELEDIRADSREMKQQINHMAMSSFGHQEFLRRTTDFTGQMLKEMKEREEQRSRRTSVESQPPLNVLGTRLDEIMKTVDDLAHEPGITPCNSPAALAPRPHSAGIPTTQSAFIPLLTQEAQKEASSAARQKRRNQIHGKLSDASLYERKRLTSGVAGLRKISEPLPKEWSSTETLAPRPKTSFSGSLGYKDYLHRHIVMSSSAIAKIRDLTPEELGDGHIAY